MFHLGSNKPMQLLFVGFISAAPLDQFRTLKL